MRQLPRAAARQDRDNLAGGVEALRGAELRAALCRAHRAYQRMADKLRGHAGIAEKLLFKRENTQCLHKALADQPHPPRTPGPELRANVIDIANTARNKLARQP